MAGTGTLQSLYQAVNPELGMDFYQQMHVVRHYVQSDYLSIHLLTKLTEKLFQSGGH